MARSIFDRIGGGVKRLFNLGKKQVKKRGRRVLGNIFNKGLGFLKGEGQKALKNLSKGDLRSLINQGSTLKDRAIKTGKGIVGNELIREGRSAVEDLTNAGIEKIPNKDVQKALKSGRDIGLDVVENKARQKIGVAKPASSVGNRGPDNIPKPKPKEKKKLRASAQPEPVQMPAPAKMSKDERVKQLISKLAKK